jgi:hypothetical protein
MNIKGLIRDLLARLLFLMILQLSSLPSIGLLVAINLLFLTSRNLLQKIFKEKKSKTEPKKRREKIKKEKIKSILI